MYLAQVKHMFYIMSSRPRRSTSYPAKCMPSPSPAIPATPNHHPIDPPVEETLNPSRLAHLRSQNNADAAQKSAKSATLHSIRINEGPLVPAERRAQSE
jgi:hypothetical protein